MQLWKPYRKCDHNRMPQVIRATKIDSNTAADPISFARPESSWYSEPIRSTTASIALLQEEEEGLPLVGRVAAGEPLLAQQHIEGHYQVDPSLFKPNADFLLRVSGMSMKDIGIMDGDLLAVHKTQDVRNGQVVVARIDDEVTVKRLKKQGNKVELLPENSEFKPIVVDLREQNFTIEGLAVGVIRNGEWL